MPPCPYHKCLKCPMTAVYNIAGVSKKGLYCKKHAEDGMVNVRSRNCSHEECTRRASYNVDGIKRPTYCKEHAQDGMINVRNKRCLHDSCKKQPYYNVEGSKTTAYCKQHAEVSMVDVRTKRCLHDPCLMHRSFGVEGSNKAVYCKTHAEVGMVNVRYIKHRRLVSRTAAPAPGLPPNMAAAAGTLPPENRILDCSGINYNSPCGVDSSMLDVLEVNCDIPMGVVDCRKRSAFELDEEQSPDCVDRDVSIGEIRQTMDMGPREDVPDTSSSHALQRHLDDDTAGITLTTEQAGYGTAGNLTPIPDKHQPEHQTKRRSEHQSEQKSEHQSGETIKTEMGLAVLF